MLLRQSLLQLHLKGPNLRGDRLYIRMSLRLVLEQDLALML